MLEEEPVIEVMAPDTPFIAGAMFVAKIFIRESGRRVEAIKSHAVEYLPTFRRCQGVESEWT